MTRAPRFLMLADFLQEWFIPWAVLAVSLFLSVLLGWLGLTVLLQAQARNWGNLLAGCGLLLGSGFFLAHCAALDYSLEALLAGSPKWWIFVAIPLLSLPFGWQILMLWSCGFWDDSKSKLARRARFPLGLSSLFFIVLVALCLYGAPHNGRLPYGELARGNGATYFAMRAISLLYPLFLVGCIGVSLYALKNPAPTGQMMTQEARRRARPYLLASSVVQFLGSCGIAVALLGFGVLSFRISLYELYNHFAAWLNLADLVVCLGISVAVILLAKAIVSFEIFTGKILPRRGFLRQLRTVVTLAACYAGLLAASLGFEMRPIFPILFTTVLMTAFLAIFSARATRDHERATQSIAPFVAAQHLTQGLLSGEAAPLQHALDEPFRALCEDVLGASRAALIARGAHASLCGAPRVFPPPLPFRAEWHSLVEALDAKSREAMPLPLDCGMNYLVPLGVQKAGRRSAARGDGNSREENSLRRKNVSNRENDSRQDDVAHREHDSRGDSNSHDKNEARSDVGLRSDDNPRGANGAQNDGEAPLGALLLGPKRDGGLYTVEEIEVARATGQHLLDSQAGATLAARLVELQRQKLAQVQTLDRRARRALHDEILPLIHGALLDLSARETATKRAETAARPSETTAATAKVSEVAPKVSEVAPEIDKADSEVQLASSAMALLTEAHHAISDLLREAPAPDSPLARRDFFQAMRVEIEREFPAVFARVEWEIAPPAHDFTARLPLMLADTLFFAAREAIRNAAKYGRGGDANRALNLRVTARIDADFMLEIRDDGVGVGAFSTSSGSGSGLSLHAAMLAIAGGFLRCESAPEGGTRVVLGLPVGAGG